MPIDWLIFSGTTEKGITIEIPHSEAGSLVKISGVSYCYNRERVFNFDCDAKEKEHQNTRQSDLYWGGGGGGMPPR
jgi:hypothetical protein